jgi:hypothetical protein
MDYCHGETSLDGHYLPLPLIIIAQLDKMFIGSKGKLTLEPCKISLHIFKEQVSNQANLPKYKNPQDKACDFHYLIHQILKSMEEYQKDYNVNQKCRLAAFHPESGCIIGDNEGHLNKLCRRSE